MIIELKNKHIFFAIENIWQYLHYKLKFQLNELVTLDSTDDKVQLIDISVDNLIQVFRSVSAQPEGVAAGINQEILAALLPQIKEQSNIAEVQAGTAEPNEASLALIEVGKIDSANRNAKAAKINNGKTQILS